MTISQRYCRCTKSNLRQVTGFTTSLSSLHPSTPPFLPMIESTTFFCHIEVGSSGLPGVIGEVTLEDLMLLIAFFTHIALTCQTCIKGSNPTCHLSSNHCNLLTVEMTR